MTDPRLDPAPGAWARLLVAVARALFPLPAAPPDAIRSVLVVRTDERVGNALLTIPLVRALQRALPRARVDLLLAARRAQVAEGLPGLRVLRFEKTDAFRHPLRFLRSLLSLRRERYQVVVDAAHWHAFSVTSALLSRFLARAWVVGHARGPAGIYSRTVPPPPADAAEVEAKLSLGDALGLRLPVVPLETALGKSPPGIAPPYAALNPGARKEDHRWPAERFGGLALALREGLGLRSVIVWGPGEEELARTAADASAGAAEVAPPTDLEQLASLFRFATLVVTNDSGPLHLAVACGAPTVAILLEPSGRRWIHPGVEALVSPDVEGAFDACARLLDRARRAAEPARTPEER